MDKALSIAFFGGGDWAGESLRRLIADGHHVTSVIPAGTRSEELRRVAAGAGLPVTEHAVMTREDFLLRCAGGIPDLIVSVDYDRILRRSLLELPRFGGINAHPGMLPRYRGVSVVTWALQNGEPEIGVTVHHLDERIDAGDIILQRPIPVGPDDANGEVIERIARVLPGLLSDAVRLIRLGRAPRTRQDHASATYFAARRESDDWIDWAAPSTAIHNLIRALSPPNAGARTMLDGHPVTIWRASLRPDAPAYPGVPGQVVGRGADGVTVKTGDRTIVIEQAQPDGAPAPVCPPSWAVGTRLGVNLAELALRLERRVKALEQRIGGPAPGSGPG
jgi:methionyl-tRNA formyltransferase